MALAHERRPNQRAAPSWRTDHEPGLLKAVTLTATGGLEHLRIQDVPPPELRAAGDVLVRVRAAALNRLDLFVVGGLPGVSYRFPHILGSDGAGVVERVGSAVSRVRPGDRVMVNPGVSCGHCEWCEAGEQPLCRAFGILGEHRPGTFAEYLVVPEGNLAPVPESMDWARAAAFPLTTLTAWRMLVTRARLRAGETVLIWGIGGGVALAALKIAKLCGARVIVTSSSDHKLARAAELGADVTLNHATQDVAREVRTLTARRGVEVVVDTVGELTWEHSLRALAPRGRLVTCGATSGPHCLTDVRKLFWYQWDILGSTMGSHGDFQAVATLAHQGRLWPEVDAVFPLDQADRALRRLAEGAQFGKVVLEVGHE
ncbi:MAG TPA: zinc-binding dehydrogenase [Gemmatimonadales bacterium]|nr:zinc-binding dehydrogenase [Gemmatimonadales bacterium]